MKKKLNEQLKQKIFQWEKNDKKIMAKEIFLFCHDNGLKVPDEIMKVIVAIIKKAYDDHREIHPHHKKRTRERDSLLYRFVKFANKNDGRTIAQACVFFCEILEGKINKNLSLYEASEIKDILKDIKLLKIDEKDIPDSRSLEKAYSRIRNKMKEELIM
ncbi:MAG: hypothetical protein GY870_20900 [archaeon]|nr:hypothetical protein [archaeon]